MNFKIRTLASSRRAIVTLATAVAVASPLASVVVAQPAGAATIERVSGRTPGVSLNGALITGRDILYYNGPYGSTYYTRTFSTAGLTIPRASAYSGSQTIYVQYFLERWANGAWRGVQNSVAYHGSVSGTGRLTFPAMSFSNPPQYTGQFPYRIAVGIVWQRNSTGAILAKERVISSSTRDNVCATRWIRCTPYTDSVVM
jgi:hypothetical protein